MKSLRISNSFILQKLITMKKVDLFKNAEVIKSDQMNAITGGNMRLISDSYDNGDSDHHDNGDSDHHDNGDSDYADNGSSNHSDNG